MIDDNSQITAPIQEQVNLDNIRNQITLSEGELDRLKKLRISEEYSVSELVKEKIWHQEEISSLKYSEGETKNRIQELQHTLEDAKTIISTAESISTTLENQRNELEASKQRQEEELHTRHLTVRSKEDELEEKKQKHTDNVESLASRESDISRREQKIAAFISELKGE